MIHLRKNVIGQSRKNSDFVVELLAYERTKSSWKQFKMTEHFPRANGKWLKTGMRQQAKEWSLSFRSKTENYDLLIVCQIIEPCYNIYDESIK